MIVVVQCRDQIGLVAAVSGAIASQKLNIISLREYVDQTEAQFFIRVEIEGASDIAALKKEMKKVLPSDALINIDPKPEKKVVVMVTKEHHCLADILVRNHFKTLGASIQCVIGNHSDLKDICKRFDVPFFLVSCDSLTVEKYEHEIIEIINKHEPDYVVLAKFMRILSPKFVEKFPTQIINIHHSFLPAFIGAHPYKQAHERGVKLIGATAHFVTNQLDDGPIIAQQIIPVNHSLTVKDMRKAGREIETAVLAKALSAVFEDRVFVYKNKTVVFE